MLFYINTILCHQKRLRQIKHIRSHFTLVCGVSNLRGLFKFEIFRLHISILSFNQLIQALYSQQAQFNILTQDKMLFALVLRYEALPVLG